MGNKYDPFGENLEDPFNGSNLETLASILHPHSDEEFMSYLLENPSIARKNGLNLD